MPSYTLAKLQSEMVEDEGLKLRLYRDTVNKLTVGIGRNIEDRGITKEEAFFLLDTDIAIAESDLDRNAAWWRSLSDARQRALLNMTMNMGWPRLSGFQKMLTALQTGDFKTAAAECLDSDAARKLPNRYRRIANMIEEG